MDPNACLTEIRETIDRMNGAMNDEHADLSNRLAELTQSLDEWLSRGGFLPTAWQR